MNSGLGRDIDASWGGVCLRMGWTDSNTLQPKKYWHTTGMVCLGQWQAQILVATKCVTILVAMEFSSNSDRHKYLWQQSVSLYLWRWSLPWTVTGTNTFHNEVCTHWCCSPEAVTVKSANWSEKYLRMDWCAVPAKFGEQPSCHGDSNPGTILFVERQRRTHLHFWPRSDRLLRRFSIFEPLARTIP